ncbi:hypothetical protein TNCV_2589041 [Trichonephila clavipes]|nr:hypothetical protein TNCV_2589041 [Trichonephila clavipes]
MAHPHTSVTTVDELWPRVEAAWSSVHVHASQSRFDSIPICLSAATTARDGHSGGNAVGFLCVHSWVWRTPDARVMGINVAMELKVTFAVHKLLTAEEESCSILERAHLTNASLYGIRRKSSWLNCNLYE